MKLDAKRKAGELLATLEREQGERNDLTLSNVGRSSSEYASTLADAEISRQQANPCQLLADCGTIGPEHRPAPQERPRAIVGR